MKRSAFVLATSAFWVSSEVLADGVGRLEMDFGLQVQNRLNAQSVRLFGISKPLLDSEDAHTPRRPGQAGNDVVRLAEGLIATMLTGDAGNKADNNTRKDVALGRPASRASSFPRQGSEVATADAGQFSLMPGLSRLGVLSYCRGLAQKKV